MNLLALHPETFRLVAFLGLLSLFALLEHRHAGEDDEVETLRMRERIDVVRARPHP